jgi:hypothetical protein
MYNIRELGWHEVGSSGDVEVLLNMQYHQVMLAVADKRLALSFGNAGALALVLGTLGAPQWGMRVLSDEEKNGFGFAYASPRLDFNHGKAIVKVAGLHVVRRTMVGGMLEADVWHSRKVPFGTQLCRLYGMEAAALGQLLEFAVSGKILDASAFEWREEQDMTKK